MLWGVHKPIWFREPDSSSRPTLKRSLHCDVVVVGAGITGLSTALKLREKGLSVVVLTDNRVGLGATGSSTAHVTRFADFRMAWGLEKWGRDKLHSVLDAASSGFEELRKIIYQYRVDCHFEPAEAFLFAEKESECENLEKEITALEELEIDFIRAAPGDLSFSTRDGIRLAGQASLDPLCLTRELARAFQRRGGLLYEFSRVTELDDGWVRCGDFEVSCDATVIATHSPIGMSWSLHPRLIPFFTYVLAVRLKNPAPRGLYWDLQDPYHYLRPMHEEDRTLLLVGGYDQRVADDVHPWDRYRELQNYIDQRFEVADYSFYWGGEILESVDKLPYIGALPMKKKMFTATGFAGCGMVWSQVAAEMNTRLILGETSAYDALFDPGRLGDFSSMIRTAKENFRVLKQMAGDWISRESLDEMQSVPPGEGRLLEGDFEKIAVYRDHEFQLHTMKPVCGHMGGIVHWNPAEKTWDCPCHGSRYSPTGEVLCGPSMKNLEPVFVERPPAPSPLAQEVNQMWKASRLESPEGPSQDVS